MEGYKTLKAGQSVSFDVIEGPKGLHAANIAPTGEASTDSKGADKPQAAAAPAAETAEQDDQGNSDDAGADNSASAS